MIMSMETDCEKADSPNRTVIKQTLAPVYKSLHPTRKVLNEIRKLQVSKPDTPTIGRQHLWSNFNYRFRKDEIFKRMKVTTFVQLIVQVADYERSQTPHDSNGSFRPDTADEEVLRIQKGQGDRSPAPSLALTEGDYGGPPPEGTDRSTLQRVIGGRGELDSNSAVKSQLVKKVLDGCPYLLLDIRDKDSYDQSHMITAKSYPAAMLSRACNYETKEMLAFRNQDGKIIVVCDENEQLAPNCVTTLVQRGYDNIFLLSGGMKVAYKIFPEGLFTGTPPQTITETPRTPGAHTERADKDIFDQEDLEKISIYLDNALCDKSSGSRLSKASTATSRMSNSTSRAGSKGSQMSSMSRVSHQAPFK